MSTTATTPMGSEQAASSVVVARSIRRSAEAATRDVAVFASRFYAKLFEHAPGLRRLFSGDMEAQGRKVVAAICLLVSMLDDRAKLERVLRDLGARHRSYGALPEHYKYVHQALLLTLEETCAPDWGEDVAKAWHELLVDVARVMEPAVAAQWLHRPAAVGTTIPEALDNSGHSEDV